MAQSRAHVTWSLCVVLAVVACFGEPAQAAGRSLLQTTTCPEPTLPDVDFKAYSGVWYQIGSTALLKSISEVDTACTTGRYSVIPDGESKGDIRVHIESYNISSGVSSAFAALATFNGKKLALQFPGAPAPSDYRIIYLGGSAKHKYKTAMTYSCTPGRIQSLIIMSRKPTLDKKETVEGLIKYAASQGIILEANNQFVHTVQDAITCGRNFA